MIQFEVKKQDTLLRTLSTETGLPFSVIQKKLREKQVMVNGIRTVQNQTLSEGDKVTIFAKANVFNPERVFEDENLVIIVKPRGIESKEAADQLKLITCHRLDRNTEGLLILAKNQESEEAVTAAFANGKIEKTYLAYVFGKPPQKSATLTHYLKKNSEAATVMVFDKPIKGSDKIITEYTVRRTNGAITMLEVRPHTGKTHQIRAHLAYIGCPVAGDGKYGNSELNKKYKLKQQELYATALCFNLSGKLAYLNDKNFTYELKTKF